ncbi:MAG: RES family NAD+ phosphorylase [Gammaproteobacteria bacterium]
MKAERLPDSWTWWRIANVSWHNPLDPGFAQEHGGRWNPPRSFPTLYLNEDQVTARLNLRAFIQDWPFEPEDLRSDRGPLLVGATLPRQQTVCDAHSPAGLLALGLPKSYPLTTRKKTVSHDQCQPLGASVRDEGLRGVRARSAQSRDGAGRELAWFPATTRSVATRVEILKYDAWYWA